MTTPRIRVIIDNDFSGDPDDLFQLAHHVLSPSVHIPFVIGSHLSPDDVFDSSDRQADNAAAIARELLGLLGRDIPVIAGSNVGLAAPDRPLSGAASAAIIREAMREDTDLPLVVALGAGLTDLASAWLEEPRIAGRLTAVWIGGPEHPDLASPPPGIGPVEYNLNIDIAAAQTIFTLSDIAIQQFPRDAYRQCLVSMAQLETRVRSAGSLGRYLADAVDTVRARVESAGRQMGETYALGDSPLVLVTALTSAFEPDASSCTWVDRPTPAITADGQYAPHPNPRPMRVYRTVDTRLMFEDMYAKFAQFAQFG